MKKLMICVLTLLLPVCMVTGADVPLFFRRGFDEPASVFPDRLKEFAYYVFFEEYGNDCLNRIDAFLELYKTDYTEQGERFIGTWKLADADGKPVDRSLLSSTRRTAFFSADEKFNIVNNEGKLTYQYDGSAWYGSFQSNLHYDSDDCYLLLRWCGIFKQIKIVDAYLYFYVLDGYEWILDPIHEGGRYRYKRYPPPENF